jgi:hypothetical protein
VLLSGCGLNSINRSLPREAFAIATHQLQLGLNRVVWIRALTAGSSNHHAPRYAQGRRGRGAHQWPKNQIGGLLASELHVNVLIAVYDLLQGVKRPKSLETTMIEVQIAGAGNAHPQPLEDVPWQSVRLAACAVLCDHGDSS